MCCVECLLLPLLYYCWHFVLLELNAFWYFYVLFAVGRVAFRNTVMALPLGLR